MGCNAGHHALEEVGKGPGDARYTPKSSATVCVEQPSAPNFCPTSKPSANGTSHTSGGHACENGLSSVEAKEGLIYVHSGRKMDAKRCTTSKSRANEFIVFVHSLCLQDIYGGLGYDWYEYRNLDTRLHHPRLARCHWRSAC